MTRLIASIAFLAILISTPIVAGAQEASPAAQLGPPSASECQISPRSESEIDALAATPVAQSSSSPSSGSIGNSALEGEKADAATLAAITTTLREVVACAEAGDLPRLLALYSDQAVRQFVLAAEPVPIIPGQPSAESKPRPATPTAEADRTPVVLDARVQPDGRIAALVTAVVPESTIDVVFFVKSGERWLIDEIFPGSPNEATPDVAGSNPVLQLALADAAKQFGVPESQLTVDEFTAKEWPDASLGCPQEGEFYAQVITPGYLIRVTGAGKTIEYHTDTAATLVLCQNP